MRLSAETQKQLLQYAYQHFGNIKMYLFGSRTDDSKKGGDIDLFIQTPKHLSNKIEAGCRLSARLYIKLGGRKVDFLIKDRYSSIESIYQQAIDYGVAL